jgi:hypothetical protein
LQLTKGGEPWLQALHAWLRPCIRHFAKVFVDYCAVHSDEWEEHLWHVDKFLQVIKDCGLTLTLKKSEFARPEVKFCDQIVGSGIRRIDPDRMQAIHQLVRPETKKQTRQILGLFGWYREYLPNFSDPAKPLTDLTGKGKPNRVCWSEREQHSFDALKHALLKAVDQPLYIIDWTIPFNTFNDASDNTIAGVLSQTDSFGS